MNWIDFNIIYIKTIELQTLELVLDKELDIYLKKIDQKYKHEINYLEIINKLS